MYKPGLKGVTAVETSLSQINGEQGMLLYRNTPIQEIIKKYSFEETAYYLLYGTIPAKEKLIIFESNLKIYRKLPIHIMRILDSLPKELSMMDVLRTAVSSVTLEHDSYLKNANQLIAIMPTIIAYRYRKIKNQPIINPDDNLNHVNNFIYMLKGNINTTHASMLETYLIMTMEHGLNASTFSARVTISTQSDLVSAITSAIGTMKGPLHGGAPSGVIRLLDEINTEDRIIEVIHNKLKNKERIMGFGHRVYKTVDPRAEALKNKINELDELPEWIKLAIKTEKETIKLLNKHKPNQRLYTNVEYYAAAIMKSLDIDPELFTAIFSSSRVIGWCAHAIEQINNNTIFRPTAKYITK
ncbi:citrate/2-methylcitrate synthase [Virgibacillus oceani]|uniref:Citrate synthase n=1 Tax=Virgibacillus oceani TaxID=1479511 RepID=A0A917LZG9_9BACI|nr:citrate/2-methylcitrate synthase [Virgibacillus oceani]GGG65854.1 citrate synthase 1 [Virgibacillus oceani]